jgi:hemerythrin
MNTHRLSFPQVALDFMNRDHQEFAELREKLLARIAAGTTAGIDVMLDELHAHTVRHFADEEQVMRETGFPVYQVHKQEHDGVLADMIQRIERWKQDGDLGALCHWLEIGVGEWLVAHIGSMDTVTARFAAAKLDR